MVPTSGAAETPRRPTTSPVNGENRASCSLFMPMPVSRTLKRSISGELLALHQHRHCTALRELDRVAGQVDQHLLQRSASPTSMRGTSGSTVMRNSSSFSPH
jgi:hypothetical protein